MAIKRPGTIRYIVELAGKSVWEPTLSTASSIFSGTSIFSFFKTGTPSSTSYWEIWGGTYDNPSVSSLQVVLGKFLKKVQSFQELELTSMSYFIDGDTVYSNTDLYPWQYYRSLSSVRLTIGYSTAVPNPTVNQSDDRLSGVRYPTRLKIPTGFKSSLPDPINGVSVQGAFSVSLENGDGFFDDQENTQFFNTPVIIKKTIVENPTLDDYVIIRYGIVDNQSVTMAGFKLKCVDLYRSFTEQVCSTIDVNLFSSADDNSVGKNMPVAWGSIKGAALIRLNQQQNEYIVCDPLYINDVYEVYNSDGEAISFTFENGIITAEDPDSCDFLGREENRIGEIITSEVQSKSNIPYIDGVWDFQEVQKYLETSFRVNLFFASGTVKKLLEEVTKSDSSFFMTKNDGQLTIRRWGERYSVHVLPEKFIMKFKSKTFTEQKYFASSIIIKFDPEYKDNTKKDQELVDGTEGDILEIYSKQQRLTYETNLTNSNDALSLGSRMINRHGKRAELISADYAVDLSAVNLLDTVSAKIETGDPIRVISSFASWIVRDVDPAQDGITLEQFGTQPASSSGLLSHISSEVDSGLLSHISSEVGSGILAQPFSVIE